MSRRYRICKAKEGRESLRPSYGPSKLTLISREKNHHRRCYEKLLGHNFDRRAKSSGENFFNIYKKILRRISLYDQNCGLIIFRNTALFLLATRDLPASPNFGQAKHGQNGPAAIFCQQGICCPICKHHFTRWTHPDISLRFRPGNSKKFPFFTKFHFNLVKKFIGLLRTQF